MTQSVDGNPCRVWLALLAGALALLPFPGWGQNLHDDFAVYPAGSDGSPAWNPESEGWEMADGAYFGDNGASVWQAAPLASAMSFACDVTAVELRQDEWLTAGIGIAADSQNYWALNLVVGPESQGRRHGVELQECVDGVWPAAGVIPTRLKWLSGKGEGFEWQTNHTYRMEVEITAATITARMLDGANEVAEVSYELTKDVKAVRAGRPFLRVNGMRARFGNAVAAVTQTAPETRVAPPFPAWISRPGPALVKGNGYFRTAQVDGRWWLVDPEGKPFFGVGTDHVNYQGHFCQKLGYAPYHRNVQAKFGDEEAWATNTIERLTAWGFNELPAGHSLSLRHRGLPHILFASLGSSFARRDWICEPKNWTGFPDVFSPRWETHCRFKARETVRDSQGDPWCIGTFIDNELEWFGKHGQLVDEVFQLSPRQPVKSALWTWLLQKYGTITGVNHHLATDYADEAGFLAATNVPQPSAALTEVHDGFLALIADRYFSVAAKALREADPEHLVLGCRFAGSVPEPVLAAAGKYDDVFTFNTYPRVDFENVWLPDGTGGVVERVPRELSGYYAVAQKPILITEWSFPALDSGLPCLHGAGMRVDTQAQKAACYRIFVNAMADLPFVIGYHYFMWADEPAQGISTSFPEDSNYGLVNEKDETYEVLVQTASEANRAAAGRHARSAVSGSLELINQGNAVAVANTNAIPAHGLVRISSAGQSRVEGISLAAGQTRRLTLSPQTVACVELQNWDGTKQRAVSGPPPGPLEVVNVSSQPLEGVPVVVEGAPPVTAWLRRLAPGQIETLAPPISSWTHPNRLDFQTEGVTWSRDGTTGNPFDQVQAGDLDLGRVVFALHQQIAGREQWTECDQVASLQVQEQPDAWLVEAEMGYGKAGSDHSYRAAVRLAVFKHGGVVLARPLWVENTGALNWNLVEVYWFCRPSSSGGSVDDVVGGAAVPEYYRAAQFWTSPKLGGCFGALDASGGWRVDYWKGPAGDFHPDARLAVGQTLEPGTRWTAEGTPFLWIFAARDATRWQTVADLARQAVASLLPGKPGQH